MEDTAFLMASVLEFYAIMRLLGKPLAVQVCGPDCSVNPIVSGTPYDRHISIVWGQLRWLV